MKFRYKAFDKSGAAKSDLINAPGPAEATEMLRRDGYFVSEVAPVQEGFELPKPRAGKSVSFKTRTRGGRLSLGLVTVDDVHRPGHVDGEAVAPDGRRHRVHHVLAHRVRRPRHRHAHDLAAKTRELLAEE